MKKLLLAMTAASAFLLSACQKPASVESVESLVANPERLKELRAACKAYHAKVGDAQCNAVAEATRRRFFGSGGPKYTPPATPPSGFWQEDASQAPAPTSSAPSGPPTAKPNITKDSP